MTRYARLGFSTISTQLNLSIIPLVKTANNLHLKYSLKLKKCKIYIFNLGFISISKILTVNLLLTIRVFVSSIQLNIMIFHFQMIPMIIEILDFHF